MCPTKSACGLSNFTDAKVLLALRTKRDPKNTSNTAQTKMIYE
jgi:hypothetical protein